ncbi:MAG: hypothetical protein COB39_08655 [Marinosulfonomonas sp.]|nr:MAG: hypothetical protein COB39_08655 [Marinosulfonomonas sp.]
MFEVFYVILPLVLLVVLGQVIAKTGQLSSENWIGLETLSFRVLIPALIIRSIAQSDLSLKSSGLYVLTMLIAVTAVGILTLLLRPITRVSDPQLSTMFQATTRFNALITLPIAAQLFGPAGLTTVTIAMAFMVPYLNVINIGLLSALHSGKFRISSILISIAKNPIIIACAIGLTINLAGIPLPEPVLQTLDMVSRSALAIGLLCVGAGFNWRRLVHLNWQIIWTVGIKAVIAPLLAMLAGQAFGLDQMQTVCAMLVVATPTATNGYIIARQMGGDAKLYAIILNWQLVVTVVAFPVLIYLMQG